MFRNMYLSMIEELKGKTIILVYSYRGEQENGAQQYDAWKGDVVTEWITAIEEIGCFPLIMDMRTFVFKAMVNSLPHTDFVVNLCNGTVSLSTLGLVPSTCSFLDIPCIPCDASVALTGENKLYSNLIASIKGLNVPKELDIHDKSGIFRPIGLGSSKGVVRNPNKSHIELYPSYTYQEFVNGYDITTPIMYNPILKDLEVLPAVIYFPTNENCNWFLGEKEKFEHMGYKKTCISLSREAKKVYLNMAKALQVNTYCRIDARIKCNSINDLKCKTKVPINIADLFFLEINPMPTIKHNINFHTSLESLSEEYSMKECLNLYVSCIKNASLTGFILSNAILANIKAKH